MNKKILLTGSALAIAISFAGFANAASPVGSSSNMGITNPTGAAPNPSAPTTATDASGAIVEGNQRGGIKDAGSMRNGTAIGTRTATSTTTTTTTSTNVKINY